MNQEEVNFGGEHKKKAAGIIDMMHDCLDPKRKPVVSLLFIAYEDGHVEEYEEMHTDDWHAVKRAYVQEVEALQDMIRREDECPAKPKEVVNEAAD